MASKNRYKDVFLFRASLNQLLYCENVIVYGKLLSGSCLLSAHIFVECRFCPGIHIKILHICDSRLFYDSLRMSLRSSFLESTVLNLFHPAGIIFCLGWWTTEFCTSCSVKLFTSGLNFLRLYSISACGFSRFLVPHYCFNLAGCYIRHGCWRRSFGRTVVEESWS